MNMEELEKIELARTEKLQRQDLKKIESKKEKLHIVYVMVWTKICGGSKIILEYANRLSQRGHKITIVTYDEKPTWFALEEKIEFIQARKEQTLEENIPECDIVVATSWKNIFATLKADCAPAVFFEQGGSHIFGTETLSERKSEIVKQRMSEPSYIYTVSSYAKECLKKYYQRDAFVVLNAVDESIFYPRETMEQLNDRIIITTIGPEEFEFKRIDNVIKAITELKKQYPNIQFKWISQTQPKMHSERAIVNPSQKEIGNILRNTDIYICASDYESFCLPALEAMTCGATVVTTDNGGIVDFIINKENGLVIEKNSVQDIIAKIRFLIENPEERIRLATNGLKTAQKMSWNSSVKRLEGYYQEIAQHEIENKKGIDFNSKEER
jgi:glycosyltransferase involved in cell wall biosynthesis